MVTLVSHVTVIISNLWSMIPQTQHNIISSLSRNNQNGGAAKRHEDRKKKEKLSRYIIKDLYFEPMNFTELSYNCSAYK